MQCNTMISRSTTISAQSVCTLWKYTQHLFTSKDLNIFLFFRSQICTEESSDPLTKYLLFWSRQPLQNLPPAWTHKWNRPIHLQWTQDLTAHLVIKICPCSCSILELTQSYSVSFPRYHSQLTIYMTSVKEN